MAPPIADSKALLLLLLLHSIAAWRWNAALIKIQKDFAQNSHSDRMARVVTFKPLILLKIVARSLENWLKLNIFQVDTKSSDLVSKTWQTKLSLS